MTSEGAGLHENEGNDKNEVTAGVEDEEASNKSTSLMATESKEHEADFHASGGLDDDKDDSDDKKETNADANDEEANSKASTAKSSGENIGQMDKAWEDSEKSTTVVNNDDAKAGDESMKEVALDPRPRDPIMQEISVRLQCCKFDHAVPTPIQQCSNGHLLCQTCLIGINKSKEPACPKCQVRLGKDAVFTNLAFGKIASQCVVPCRYEHLCNVKCQHSDLEKHLKYCTLPTRRKEQIDPKDFDWKATEVEADDAGIRAMAVVAREIMCNFCNEACPPPIQQCKSGHIACSYCLERMRKADSPTCPFCFTDISVTGRNLHLEEMAVGNTVKCRFEGCSKEMAYPKLAEHLATCECQPILCVTCDAKADTDARYVSWDAMWEHYKTTHLERATPTQLDNMILKDEHIQRMLTGKLGFITWGHSLNANGSAVRVFPGMYYSKERETFYFTIRIMAPLLEEEEATTFGLIVTSPTSPVKMVGHFPAISYRVPHKYTTNSPCLAISVATMKLMTEGGEGIKFEIALPEGLRAKKDNPNPTCKQYIRTYIHVKCQHSDLEKHLKYCTLPTRRKEQIDPKDFDWKATEVEADDASIRAMAVVAREIMCNRAKR